MEWFFKLDSLEHTFLIDWIDMKPSYSTKAKNTCVPCIDNIFITDDLLPMVLVVPMEKLSHTREHGGSYVCSQSYWLLLLSLNSVLARN